MNPVIYQRCHVVATRICLSPEGLLGPRFSVEVAFSPEGRSVVLQRVYLAEAAQALIASGRVTGVSVETLAANGLATSLLGNPLQLLTGIELDEGTRICVIPAKLRKTRFLGLLAATATCLGSIGWMLTTGHSLVPALLLVVATHAARSLLAIPVEAFPGMKMHEALPR